MKCRKKDLYWLGAAGIAALLILAVLLMRPLKSASQSVWVREINLLEDKKEDSSELLAWWGYLYPGLGLESAMELVEETEEDAWDKGEEGRFWYQGLPVKICFKWF